MYTAIFVSAFVLGWLICAYLPWFLFSISTRGNAGLSGLPLSLFSGVVAALAVPLLGLTNSTGLWLSFAVAFLVPAALLTLRPYAAQGRPAHPRHERQSEAEHR